MKQISKMAMVVIITTAFVLLTACGGGGSSIEGTWSPNEFEIMGQSFTMSDFEQLAAIGGEDISMLSDMTYEFKSDDVFVMNFMGESMEGTYSVNGSTVTVEYEGVTQTMELDGSNLILSDNSMGMDMTIIFTK